VNASKRKLSFQKWFKEPGVRIKVGMTVVRLVFQWSGRKFIRKLGWSGEKDKWEHDSNLKLDYQGNVKG